MPVVGVHAEAFLEDHRCIGVFRNLRSEFGCERGRRHAAVPGHYTDAPHWIPVFILSQRDVRNVGRASGRIDILGGYLVEIEKGRPFKRPGTCAGVARAECQGGEHDKRGLHGST